jgi:hypothetical protein
MATKPLCSIPGCGKPHHGRSYCQAHLIRLRKHGDPLAGGIAPAQKGSLPDWIYSNAETDSDECLLWPFKSVYRDGYGSMKINGVMVRAHRFMCELAHGAPPSAKHEAAHSCNVRLCCNPRHLRWATTTENAADKKIHGTDPSGERHGLSKLRADQIREIRRLRGTTRVVDIASLYGVSASTIYLIFSGERWTSVV